MFKAKVLADSVYFCDGKRFRVTTIEACYPRIIHAEFLRHRVFSRCAASSRAIPVNTFIKKVQEDPFIPIFWGKNQKGMKANEEVSQEDAEKALSIWKRAAKTNCISSSLLSKIGIHKQITNRLLEPWQWVTEIITGTEWDNFFNLRVHADAQPEIRKIAELIKEEISKSTPKILKQGEWHLPLFFDDDEQFIQHELGFSDKKTKIKVSSGRCARTSYLTHFGKRDIKADIALHDRLLSDAHMSPLEHPVRPMTSVELNDYKMFHYVLDDGSQFSSRIEYKLGDVRDNKIIKDFSTSFFCGNYNGYISYRKHIPNESNPLGDK